MDQKSVTPLLLEILAWITGLVLTGLPRIR